MMDKGWTPNPYPDMKWCPNCCDYLPLDRFGSNRSSKGKHATQSLCRPCTNEYQRRRRASKAVKDSERTSRLKQVYGLAPGEYDEMLAAQGGVCWICGGVNADGRRLGVDHNHETGAVRGLLCTKCNNGLGMAGDDPQRLRLMARYLSTLSI